MNAATGTNARSGTPRFLALLGGLVWLAAVGLLTPLPARLHPSGVWPPGEAEEARRNALVLAALGAALFGIALGLARRPPARRAERWTVFLSVLVTLALVLEAWTAPFVERPTRIFEPDPELGWRLVPGAEDSWLGAQVRINAQGMRGPPRERAKPAGVRRVLVLGDSVIFGAFIERDEDTIPARLEAELRRDGPVECLNAGVGGYSPWQEAIWLERRGLAWSPDLVVLGFVLNDVTEWLGLARFGGEGEGFQLEHALPQGWRAWVERWSVVRLWRERVARRRRALTPWSLMLEPNRDDVQAAWRATQEILDRLRASCERAGVSLLLVVFPFREQLRRDGLDAPQTILGWWAGRRPIAYLDPLPELRREVRAGRLDPDDVFVDEVHPSARGAALFAERIAAEIRRRGLFSSGGPGPR